MSIVGWPRPRSTAASGDGLTTTEREELSRLRRELRVVREERYVLAKAIAFFTKDNDPVSRYRFITQQKAQRSVVLPCRVLGLAKSAF